MDRCALPTSWLDCFKSDNKNETISTRVRPRTLHDEGGMNSGRGVSNERDFFVQLLPRLRLRVPLIPHQYSPRERGVKLPTLSVFRLPNDWLRTVRLAQVAMETDEKRRPGLFETIIRRSILLLLVPMYLFARARCLRILSAE